jgi:hypothetical protein
MPLVSFEFYDCAARLHGREPEANEGGDRGRGSLAACYLSDRIEHRRHHRISCLVERLVRAGMVRVG